MAGLHFGLRLSRASSRLAGVVAACRGRSLGIWDGPIQLAYHIDGLSLMFALMGAGIGTAVLL